jgi:hypothetical protein
MTEREYYAEEVFGGQRKPTVQVYTGPLLMAWVSVMVGCFGMSAACAVSGGARRRRRRRRRRGAQRSWHAYVAAVARHAG